jgi:hypothetical protein
MSLCAPAMMNNFAPRGTCTVVNLIFGTAGSTVTPSKDDEYSDLSRLHSKFMLVTAMKSTRRENAWRIAQFASRNTKKSG